MYEDIKMAVRLPGGLTPFFESLVGVRQGCSLSPMSFNIYVNDLIEELQNDECDPVIINNCSISCLMYAEDLLVLSESWEGLTAQQIRCTFQILGGGRVGGLRMCHPPYHPLDFQSKI